MCTFGNSNMYVDIYIYVRTYMLCISPHSLLISLKMLTVSPTFLVIPFSI